ncbi:MAG TPA: undecaprenyldiphospho-muramoylpentapeptide beta-N-acetylglucosaminyltransferase [Anaerolineales bacterium]|nr:undecaprenyldiphospho-muramoylpentapeptide beta-N-acetylglucosaminyltransferase [Anaerolineales bacterium]
MFRLLVSAGGTGGGVYPALAIAAALGPKAEILWLGGEGMETSLVPRAGIPFASIPAAGVHGVGWRALPGNVMELARGVAAAGAHIRRFRPDVMFLTGGYVGVPTALAGWTVPKVVYVPDIEPGLALRFMARSAKVVAVTAEPSRRFHPRAARVVVTGYPARPTLRPMDRSRARSELGLDPRSPVLLVTGGSQGARSINEAVWARLRQLLLLAQIVHLTGEADWPRASEARRTVPESLAARYHAYPYLHDEMARAYASADLVVSRAGASTLGELPLFGLPAILVPYPHAWRYQRVNADYLVERGAAVTLDDSRLETDLVQAVRSLLEDPEGLAAMSAAARRQAAPDAAERIAAEIERIVEAQRG